jgi:hypothetical protein
MKVLVKCAMTILVAIWANVAFALPIIYTAQLDGPNESPPNASPATGFAEVALDIVAHSLLVDVTFSGLLGTTTAGHIHGPTATPGEGTAGVATMIPTFSGFPFGVTSGTYHNIFDTTLDATFNPAFISANGGTAAGAEAALAESLAEGTAYLNIHTSLFPGGEIRGFLAQPLPEPSTFLLLGSGLLGLFGLGRRFRKADLN